MPKILNAGAGIGLLLSIHREALLMSGVLFVALAVAMRVVAP